jgi:hypothetical protein
MKRKHRAHEQTKSTNVIYVKTSFQWRTIYCRGLVALLLIKQRKMKRMHRAHEQTKSTYVIYVINVKTSFQWCNLSQGSCGTLVDPPPPAVPQAGAAAAAGIVLLVDSSSACIHSAEVTRTRRHGSTATGTGCLLV